VIGNLFMAACILTLVVGFGFLAYQAIKDLIDLMRGNKWK